MLALVAAGLGAAIVPDSTLAYLAPSGVTALPATDLGERTLTTISPRRRPPATDRLHRLLIDIAGST